MTLWWRKVIRKKAAGKFKDGLVFNIFLGEAKPIFWNWKPNTTSLIWPWTDVDNDVDIGRTVCTEFTLKLPSWGPGLTPRLRKMEEQTSATKFWFKWIFCNQMLTLNLLELLRISILQLYEFPTNLAFRLWIRKISDYWMMWTSTCNQMRILKFPGNTHWLENIREHQIKSWNFLYVYFQKTSNMSISLYAFLFLLGCPPWSSECHI